jgi:hypothetical protein
MVGALSPLVAWSSGHEPGHAANQRAFAPPCRTGSPPPRRPVAVEVPARGLPRRLLPRCAERCARVWSGAHQLADEQISRNVKVESPIFSKPPKGHVRVSCSAVGVLGVCHRRGRRPS